MSIRMIVLFLGVAWCALMHQAIADQNSGGDALAACSQPMITGPCRASITRYGYDPTSHTCVVFIYGGCEGNANNFGSQEECESACGVSNL